MTLVSDPLNPPDFPDLESLVSQLQADAISEATFSERNRAHRCLFWVVLFLNGKGIGTDLIGPLWMLLGELDMLDEGIVGPITKKPDGRDASPFAAPSRAIALALVEHYLNRLGLREDEALARLFSGSGIDWTWGDVTAWRARFDEHQTQFNEGGAPEIGFSFPEYEAAVVALAERPEVEHELLEKLKAGGFIQKKRVAHSRRSAIRNSKLSRR